MTKGYNAILENWYIECVDGAILLHGDVYYDNANRFSDGTPVTTTPVMHGEILRRHVVETRSKTRYYLGRPKA